MARRSLSMLMSRPRSNCSEVSQVSLELTASEFHTWVPHSVPEVP